MAQLGTIKLQTDSGIVDVPVFDVGDSGGSTSEALRVQTDSGIGFVPLVDPADAASPQEAIRVQTDSGVKAVTDSASQFQLPNSIISQYQLEQDATDSIGSRNGTNNGATFVSDSVQGSFAADFDPANNAVITLPSYGSLLQNPLTMVVFFKDRSQSTNFSRLWSFEDEFTVILRHDSSNNYEIAPGEFKQGASISISNIPSNTYCMIAGRVDYSTNFSELDIITPTSSFNATGSAPSSPDTQSNSTAGLGSSAGFDFDGRLDNALFADSILTDQQISDIANQFL